MSAAEKRTHLEARLLLEKWVEAPIVPSAHCVCYGSGGERNNPVTCASSARDRGLNIRAVVVDGDGGTQSHFCLSALPIFGRERERGLSHVAHTTWVFLFLFFLSNCHLRCHLLCSPPPKVSPLLPTVGRYGTLWQRLCREGGYHQKKEVMMCQPTEPWSKSRVKIW